MKFGILLGCVTIGAAMAADVPQADIANGVVKAKLYLPDAQNGYYQGTRFDWAGVIASLEYKGHNYFGKWFDKYDPKIHDAITGPVEEFMHDMKALGYDEAKPGELFVKIGVGAIKKLEERQYKRFGTYEIADTGNWSTKKGADFVEFTQELKDSNGYAYIYKKTVRLTKGKPELVLEHSLKNTGKKVIDTDVYNHDFYMLDGVPTGPDTIVKFPFEVSTKDNLRGLAELHGKDLVYPKDLEKGQSAAGDMLGFGATAKDYDIRVENKKAGIGVRQVGDRPLSRMYFWSIPTTVCPEAYVSMKIEPGRDFTWKIAYEFYTLGK